MSAEAERSRNAAAILVDAHIAATQGNRRALVYRDKTYTYHDLAALVNRAGNMLRSQGVERDARVLILLSPSPVMFGVMLGAIKIGAVAVMLGESPDAGAVRAAGQRYAPAVAIVDGARFDELREALGSTTRTIVAGEAHDEHPSLVGLLRAAPSSLAAEAVEDSTAALIVIGGDGAVSATHALLVDAGQGKPLPTLRLGKLDLSAALALLAECKEVAIPAAQP